MNRDDIIRMAREADEGFETDTFHAESLVGMDAIERFAALVAAAEQDRCCKIVYSMAGSDNVAQRTVDAIRGQHG